MTAAAASAPLSDAFEPDALARRSLYALMLAAGVFMMAFGSYLFSMIPPIPLKYIPDLRLAFLLGSSVAMGIAMAWGGASRRAFALYGVVGYVLAFHLEEATIHWIGPVPGSITGTRVGLLGTAGSILALAAVLLMHVDVESARLRRDAIARGAPDEAAGALAARLASAGRRRIAGVSAAVAAFGLFLFVAEKGFGDTAKGGGYILLVGGALLLALALYLLKLVPGRDRAR